MGVACNGFSRCTQSPISQLVSWRDSIDTRYHSTLVVSFYSNLEVELLNE